MVIGERFVWVHIPKTGGDSTRKRIEHASEEGTSADQVLKRFAGGETIVHWLRTEFLAEDFIEVLGKYVEVSEAQRKMIRATRENVNPTYNRDILLWYTRKQMTYVYESNPSWTMLEKQIYGNTLLDKLW